MKDNVQNKDVQEVKLKGIPQLTVLVIIITFSIHIYKLLITFGLVLHFREQLKNTMPLFIIMEIVIWIFGSISHSLVEGGFCANECSK